MIPLVKNTINEKDIDSLIEWLKTYPRLTKGEQTKKFEEQWSAWLGKTKYSVFVNSGSSAILLMLYAMKLSGAMRNDRVVVPGIAWSTDVSPIMQLGMKPVLCDVDLDTLSVDVKELERVFQRTNPSALLLVSILGFAPKLQEIADLCTKHNVILLEDNCESVGTTYNDIRLGNFGSMSAFSFYFGHHISTIEGGMVSTNDEWLYNLLVSIRAHGWSRDWSPAIVEKFKKQYNVSDFENLYKFYFPGFNVRPTDLQAVIGLGQMTKIDSICEKRVSNFNYLQENIKNEFWKPKPLPNSVTSNFCYPIISPKRMEIVDALKKADIETRPLVCGSIGRQPFFSAKYGERALKNCDIVDKLGLYVPNNPDLTTDELKLIVDTVNSVTNV